MNYQEQNLKSGHFYGLESQLAQTQEEAAELIQAINKYKRARGVGQPTPKSPERTRLDLVEEIVDVSILLEQLRELLLITEREFDDLYEAKVLRTLRKMA